MAEIVRKRDSSGRWLPGVSGNEAGRKALPWRESVYHAKLTEVCSLDAWGEIVAKAVELAKEGDHSARLWLSRYVLPQEQLQTFLSVEKSEIVIKVVWADPPGDEAVIEG